MKFINFYISYLRDRFSLGTTIVIFLFLVAEVLYLENSSLSGLVVTFSTISLVLLIKQNVRRLLILIICVCQVFFFQGNYYVRQTNHVIANELNSKKQIFTGVIVNKEYSRSDDQLYTISIESIGSSKTQDFLVQVKFKQKEALEIGDLVTFEGEAYVPKSFDSFDYKQYLNDKKIFLEIRAPIINTVTTSHSSRNIFRFAETLKSIVLGKLEESISPDEAGLMMGLLLGIKETVPEDWMELFNKAGISHIVVASGYNVVLLMNFSNKFAGLFHRKVTVYVSIILVMFLIVLVGIDNVPIMRSGIFGCIFLLGGISGRKRIAIESLLMVSAGMLMFNIYLYRDLSFLLSFASTIGLLTYSDLFRQRFKLPLVLEQLEFIPTLVAITWTLPITIVNFDTFSTIAIVVNLLVLSVIPYTLSIGVVLLLTSFVGLNFLSTGLGFILHTFLLLFIQILRVVTEWEFAQVTVRLGISVYLIYILLIGYALHAFFRDKTV